MLNFVAEGTTLDVIAPSDGMVAGMVYKFGDVLGVSPVTVVGGVSVALQLGKVYDLPKVGSQAWSVGQSVYWDENNSRCTTTAGELQKLGVAVRAVGSGAGETSGRVRLNASF